MPAVAFRRRDRKTQNTKAVTAAAATLSAVQLRGLTRTKTGEDWQQRAWEHYDICGELRYGANWIGNALSRARLFAAVIDDNEDEPIAVEEGRPAEIVAELHGGAAGQSQMLKRLGLHLSVPGESFVATWQDENAAQRWATLCGDEIDEDNGIIKITLDGETIELPEDDHVIIRVWRPHGRKHWEADSPARGLLPELRKLERLTAHVNAQVDSRLAGAGVLLLPDNLTFPVETTEGEVRMEQGSGAFLRVLAAAMVTPIEDRDDVSAVVPILAQAPPEAIAAVRHITFSTELDAQTLPQQEAAIRRLALGLDMPPEVLLGMSTANHWSAWEISENAVTQHIEPLLTVIVDAFTTGYYRPALEDAGVPDAHRHVIWFDTSELVNRPNRGPDAIQLYDRGELNGEALRREHGFPETDALSAAERRQRELRDLLAGAGVDSTTANRLLELLGYVQSGALPDAVEAPAVQVPSTREPAPAAQPRAIPARPAAAELNDPAVFAAQVVAQYAAHTALEYAGKRLLASDRSYRAQFRDVPHHELHTHIPVNSTGPRGAAFLLEGAFRTFDVIPELAPLRPAVENYVTHLLVTGSPFDRAQLAAAISRTFA